MEAAYPNTDSNNSICETRHVEGDRSVRGLQLRYVLVHLLSSRDGHMTVQELIAGCERGGVVFDGRASKLISDALRWEVKRGRVVRLARGVYAFRSSSRTTMWRIRKYTRELFDRLRKGDTAGRPPSAVHWLAIGTHGEWPLLR